MVQRQLLITVSTFLTCGLLHQAGAQYSAAEKTKAWVEIRNVVSKGPQVVSARCRISQTLDVTLVLTSSMCWLNDSVLSRRTLRYFGAC